MGLLFRRLCNSGDATQAASASAKGSETNRIAATMQRSLIPNPSRANPSMMVVHDDFIGISPHPTRTADFQRWHPSSVHSLRENIFQGSRSGGILGQRHYQAGFALATLVDRCFYRPSSGSDRPPQKHYQPTIRYRVDHDLVDHLFHAWRIEASVTAVGLSTDPSAVPLTDPIVHIHTDRVERSYVIADDRKSSSSAWLEVLDQRCSPNL